MANVLGYKLPTSLKPGLGLVSGELLNRVGSQLNSLVPALSASHQNSSMGNTPVGQPSVIIGVAEIVSVSSKSSYLGSFRYLDPADGTWKNSSITFPIDSSIYNSITGKAEPRYKVGDKIAALYDPRSFLFVPLHSPPDYSASLYIASESKTEPGPSESQLATVDATHVVLERLRGGSGQPDIFKPDMIIRSGSRFGRVTSSISMIVTVEEGDRFRMRCGTGKYSRAVMYVNNSGMSFRWLGRDGAEANAVEILQSYNTDGFSTITDMLPTAYCDSRYQDAPQASFQLSKDATDLSSGFVTFTIPGITKNRWVAEVTIFATVEQANIWAFAKIRNPSQESDSQNAPNSAATWVKPDSNGYHDAVMVMDHTGKTYASTEVLGVLLPGSRDMRIWLAFIDRWPAGTKDIIGEVGLVYGPVVYSGIEVTGDNGEMRPLWVCTIVKEEYIGTYDGDLKRGESADFRLLNSQFEPNDPEVKVNAVAKANPYKRDTYATITRVNGIMLANQLACAKTSPNQTQ